MPDAQRGLHCNRVGAAGKTGITVTIGLILITAMYLCDSSIIPWLPCVVSRVDAIFLDLIV